MIHGVVLAGGTGKRMRNPELPKQFIELNGTPIVIRTIQKMLRVPQFDTLYVAIHPDWTETLEALVEAYVSDPERVTVIAGGKERLDSITNILNAIVGDHGCEDDDIIVLHDGVRPFVSLAVLEESIQGAKKHPAVVAAVPAVDTMLWIEGEGETVSDMPDRSKLFHGQAPDSFKLRALKESLESLTEEEREIVTGTAQICMLKGIPVYPTLGDRNNIKITTPEDLILAQTLLENEGIQ